MSLSIVALPIGNRGDITSRAIETLKTSDIIIGEERSEISKTLKYLNIQSKDIRLLNEHSTIEEINELAELCGRFECALVSDCGTPIFCDPGSALIERLRKKKVPIRPVPGVSSLTCILSMLSQKLTEFVFVGFLPAENVARSKKLNELKSERRALVFMDTPYRLSKTASELAKTFPNRKGLLGLNMTYENEEFIEDLLPQIAGQVANKKAEFILVVY